MIDENDFYWKHTAEIYRQNYQDALDEVRELRSRVQELETENQSLRKNKNHNENYVLENYKIFYGK